VNRSWWPAASGVAWSWSWRAEPGVWPLAGGIAALYLAWVARAAPDARPSRQRIACFVGGWLVLWGTLDWPAGALAAGYLLSARAAQYLLVTMVAAPLLLLGTPREAAARFPRLARGVGRAAHPRVAVPAFAGVLLVTFLPPVVDGLAPHPAGVCLENLAWLAAALLFWWRIAGPEPEGRRLPYLAGLVYLFLPFLFPKVPGIVFAFHGSPLYAAYAGAPRVFGLSHLADQQLAGMLLWFVGSVMVIGALAALFFRWYAEDRRLAQPDSLAIPADQRAVHLLFEVPGAWTALEQLVAMVSAALPAGHRGAELHFAYQEHAAANGATRVLLELRAALDPPAEAALRERVEREWGAALRRLGAPERERIRDRLGFRVVTYGLRVG
jgi:putative membrane protein